MSVPFNPLKEQVRYFARNTIRDRQDRGGIPFAPNRRQIGCECLRNRIPSEVPGYHVSIHKQNSEANFGISHCIWMVSSLANNPA